jgi:hypothetical protein
MFDPQFMPGALDIRNPPRKTRKICLPLDLAHNNEPAQFNLTATLPQSFLLFLPSTSPRSPKLPYSLIEATLLLLKKTSQTFKMAPKAAAKAAPGSDSASTTEQQENAIMAMCLRKIDPHTHKVRDTR